MSDTGSGGWYDDSGEAEALARARRATRAAWWGVAGVLGLLAVGALVVVGCVLLFGYAVAVMD